MFNLKKSIMIGLTIVIFLVAGFALKNNRSISNDTVQAGVASGVKPTSSPNVSEIHAPDFTLWTLEGDKFQLSDLYGRVLLINFWATWCPPCRAEIPDLVELSEEHKDEGFDVVAVTLQSGSPAEIAKFAKKFNMTYWVLTSENDSDINNVTSLYGKATGVPITGIPTTFLVDRNGIIRGVYVGPRSKAQFWKDIQKYL